MKKQIEEELKAKGYVIVEEDGTTYLHVTSELNTTLQNNTVLSESMVELIIQKHINKIVIH